MSILVTMRVPGDTEQFRRFIASEDDRLRAMRDAAQGDGCLHHRFGVGDGFVLVVDEWESKEAFERFFRENTDLPGLMRDAGAQGEPEFTFTEAVTTADQY